MRPQLELFARAPMKVQPASGRTEPRLWVRRLVLWSEPGVVVRDIGLRKGLNVIWSPDPGDTGESAETSALGHGAGKTLFCRLLRYCLGEDRFAPEGQRDDISAALRDGIVGAEVMLHGKPWAVTRSIGHRRRHVALADGDLESLASADVPSTGLDELVGAIGDQIVTTPIASLVPGTRADRAWLTALAWLTRDQECRFGDALEWRAASSDSDSPVRGFSRTEALFALRALLGAFSPAEQAVRAGLVQLEEQLGRVEDEANHRAWGAERMRIAVISALTLSDADVLPGRLAIEGLRRAARVRLGQVQQLPANDVDGDNLGALRVKLEDARRQLSVLETERATLEARLPLLRSSLAKTNSELPGVSAATDEAENPVCPVCEVPIDQALAAQCKLSHKLHDVETTRLRYRRLEDEAAQLRQAIDDDVERQRALGHSLKTATDLVTALRTRIGSIEHARDTRGSEWETAARLLDDVQRLEIALVEQEDAANRANDLRNRLEQLRKDSGELRGSQADVFNRLAVHFNEIVRHLASAAAEGSVRLTGRGLELGIRMGGNRSTAAIESLKVIAFDLATMILAIEGHAYLPAFLVHDSPREADLGLSSYHQLFALARSLEGVGAEPLFQYIVTTTTRPPDDVRCEPWLRLTLRGGPASERLLRRDL
jgi:hypothetical protein